jgi:hypothetical protein
MHALLLVTREINFPEAVSGGIGFAVPTPSRLPASPRGPHPARADRTGPVRRPGRAQRAPGAGRANAAPADCSPRATTTHPGPPRRELGTWSCRRRGGHGNCRCGRTAGVRTALIRTVRRRVRPGSASTHASSTSTTASGNASSTAAGQPPHTAPPPTAVPVPAATEVVAGMSLWADGV